jgi:hypothetical protein
MQGNGLIFRLVYKQSSLVLANNYNHLIPWGINMLLLTSGRKAHLNLANQTRNPRIKQASYIIYLTPIQQIICLLAHSILNWTRMKTHNGGGTDVLSSRCNADHHIQTMIHDDRSNCFQQSHAIIFSELQDKLRIHNISNAISTNYRLDKNNIVQRTSQIYIASEYN